MTRIIPLATICSRLKMKRDLLRGLELDGYYMPNPEFEMIRSEPFAIISCFEMLLSMENIEMRRKKKSVLNKILHRLIGEAIVGFVFFMLYVHRNLIMAAIKGEELPKAPKGCLAYKEET